jgi:hypothetical protein
MKRRLVAGSLVAGLVAGFITLAPVSQATTAAAVEADACTPIAIMAFRGSGETPASMAGQDAFKHIRGTVGWEGGMLHRLLLSYEAASAPGVVEDVPVIDIGPAEVTRVMGVDFPADSETVGRGYPAIPLQDPEYGLVPWGLNPVALIASADQGADEAVQRIQEMWAETPSGCAPTRFIALGYSQGAMAARTAVQTLPQAFVGSMLYGDPYQAGGAKWNQGDGAQGSGLMRTMIPLLNPVTWAYNTSPVEKASLCHKDDSMCNFRIFGFSTEGHVNYLVGDGNVSTPDQGQREYDQKGAELAALVSRALGARAPEARPLDIVIQVDEAIGGGDKVRSLASSMDDVQRIIDARGGNVLISVIGYGYSSRVVYSGPTADLNAVKSAILQVPAKRKNISQMSAMLSVINNPEYFRPNADRAILNVSTDEWPYEACYIYACTRTKIIDALRTELPAVTLDGEVVAGPKTRVYDSGLQLPGNDRMYSFPFELSSDKGSDTYSDVFRDILSAPRASLGLPAVVIAGQSVTIGTSVRAGESGSVKIGTDPDPLPMGLTGSAVFPKPGLSNVELTVQGADGTSSTINWPVTVIDATDLRIPRSPRDGAPKSDAALNWDDVAHQGQDLSVSASLEPGSALQVRMIPKDKSGEDPFLAEGSTILTESENAPSRAPVTTKFSISDQFAVGEYILLITESSGPMVEIPITVVGPAGPVASIQLSQSLSDVAAGGVFPKPPVVRLLDAEGHRVPNSELPVSLGISGSSGSLKCAVSGETLVAVDGLVSFPGCSIALPGDYSITALGGGMNAASNMVSVLGPATRLLFSVQPGAGTGGVPMQQQPVVEIVDSANHRVSTGSPIVSMQLQSEAGAGINVVNQCSSAPSSFGLAKLAGCRVDPAGVYRYRASSPGMTSALSEPFRVGVGTLKSISWRQTSSWVAGTVSTSPISVWAFDAGNNMVKSDQRLVRITAPGITGCTPAPIINSMAEFSGCVMTAAGTQTVSASVDGIPTIKYSATVKPGALSTLSFTTYPLAAKAGIPLSPNPTVSMQDRWGNPLIGVPVPSVTLTSSDGQPAHCVSTSVTPADGILVFQSCLLALSGDTQLVASAVVAGATVSAGGPVLAVTP